jgi:hypothetical protein
MDKQIQSDQSTSSNIFLTGIILLANLDFAGLMELTGLTQKERLMIMTLTL